MAKIINQSSHVYRIFKQSSSVKRQASSVNDYLHMTQPANPLTL
ncbi:hypothetical protein EJK55_1659 [Moraxella catarrhalis]|uniref:Uncharacterized protein n=1 Tax=Moraxella catarrhalis TaxID=480 RepID=A0ABY0BKW2_MORCA|nr:hypothetical protein [Moraxella catarrhalis]RUO16437.1 hypothetical protein EJK54_1690 [Moraxella catarrhalis]RUO16769.1 hypothetical protein EJK55_1659 [Moraxella catarrhalis]